MKVVFIGNNLVVTGFKTIEGATQFAKRWVRRLRKNHPAYRTHLYTERRGTFVAEVVRHTPFIKKGDYVHFERTSPNGTKYLQQIVRI